MKRAWIILVVTAVFAAATGGLLYFHEKETGQKDEAKAQHVVVNEALRTLLYLPVYHAIERGHFRKEGLDVDLVTGGTATNAFSAMVTGAADFAIADPMYVPISREQGAATKVVGQVVARIALWALSKNPDVAAFDRGALEGRKISTHVKPMTAYTYTYNRVAELGLKEGQTVEIIQSRPGTETVPFLSGTADFVVTLEPGTSIAEGAGAHIVYSWPEALGDRIFTGLMTREDLIAKRRPMVIGAVRALAEAMAGIRADRAAALATARKYFPQVEDKVLSLAIDRLIRESVIPASPALSERSWNEAVEARREIGDLKGPAPYGENVDADIIQEALH
jgi:NitT/TauT family transport system substrate-binding protein